MSALHVVVRPRPRPSSQSAWTGLNGLIDVVVDGINLTARVGEGPALEFLIDLSFGVAALVEGPRQRTTVPLACDGEAWEIGLEAAGSIILLSVFRPSPVPVATVCDREVPVARLRTALLEAIDETLRTQAKLPVPIAAGLKESKRRLEPLSDRTASSAPQRTTVSLSVAQRGLRLSGHVLLREIPERELPRLQAERADLHSLLLPGALTLRAGPNRITLPRSQVFLDSERMLHLAEAALAAELFGLPTFRRTALNDGRFSLRRGPGEAPLELRLDADEGRRKFVAEIATTTFVRSVCGFALELAQAIRQREPAQERNLRLSNFEGLARELLDQLTPARDNESITNPEPESYRRFVPRVKRSVGLWEQGMKMRFVPRWVATVPNIDLRATFLCGDRLIVGGSNETACLARRDGEVLWKEKLRPAASVVTPQGLVRIEPDGRLSCHHLESGEVRFALRLTPRTGGGATGSVLHGPGVPNLLALTEGDRQVTGIDLSSGEIRWRYTAPRAGAYKVRRAGKLLIVSGTDPLLVALDGATGDVVWSLRARLPFRGDVGFDHDSACAVSGAPGGSWLLHRLDPWSGKEHWVTELDERPLGRAPLLTSCAIVVPTLEEEGTGAIAFDRETGKKLWEHAPGLLSATTAWLAVDDCILINCARGILMGLNAHDGSVRFNSVFSSGCESDQPRRLEPVLRNGALFVPQESVHVVRPLDGELLGTLPSDLVPDLIRVDERCDVYVAEESGHFAAFGVAPRLALVR